MALPKKSPLAKLKMPAPKKDPMLELDEMDMEEESPEEEAAEEEAGEAEEEAAADLSEVSDDDLIAELEARGMSVSQAASEEAAASEEQSEEE